MGGANATASLQTSLVRTLGIRLRHCRRDLAGDCVRGLSLEPDQWEQGLRQHCGRQMMDWKINFCFYEFSIYLLYKNVLYWINKKAWNKNILNCL